jgi:hypothetical protein
MNKSFVKYLLFFLSFQAFAQNSPEKLSYHFIQTDDHGHILPWYNPDPGISYDHIVQTVWNFWDTMRTDLNGLPYYMNHQVWTKGHNDARGVGGDQMAMAISSWRQLYAYTGNQKILDNLKFIADYYLSHSLSPSGCKWENLPYPYNTLIYSGIYDGDMLLGKGFTQPDKAGSFGFELINIYKITGNKIYLDAAEDIANTLSKLMIKGDNDHSPLPYRVNAITGEIGSMNKGTAAEITYPYTSNWVGTMKLFSRLISLGTGDTANYLNSFQILLDWMKQYPMKTNKWGPFFEDVGAWSDTQINAVTFAQFILENPELFPDWKESSRRILDWVYQELGNSKWEKYGAEVVNEQTDYRIQGNSHTARQGAIELLYAAKTGDTAAKERGIRQLNWATYMVNDDGENTYPNNETWMTDGYGDYIRHYLKAMEVFPEMAPGNQDHLVSSSSVVKKITYTTEMIQYETFDKASVEVLRLKTEPKEVKVNDIQLPESGEPESWKWKALESGGLLEIKHHNNKITIIF